MKLFKPILLFAILMLFDGVVLAAPSCYTTNCTGTAIRNRRDCYLCCGEHCMGGTNETDCQEDCDGAWIRTIQQFFPERFGNYLLGLKYDPKGQHELLTDAEFWDWRIVDNEVEWPTLEVADWLLQNAVGEANERLAVVNLAWLAQDHILSAYGREVVKTGLRASLYSENASVRAGAIIGLRETGFALEDPALMLEMIRLIANDPSPKVKRIGIQVVSKVH